VWFGLGLQSKLVIAFLVAFFPIVVDTAAGMRATPAGLLELARSLRASRLQILLKIEFPAALPSIFAGLRVATVSTVALATIGYLIGEGGLGNLIHEGLTNYFKAEVLTASVLCVLLAIAFDAVLVGLQFLVTPWARIRWTRRTS